MKALLSGIQKVDFTNDQGEHIKGSKLHLIGSSQSIRNIDGCPVAIVWYTGDVSGLTVGHDVELVYDQQFGTNKQRLVDVREV